MPIIKTIQFIPLKLPIVKTLKLKKLLDDGTTIRKKFNHFMVWVCEIYTDEAYGQGYTYTIPVEVGKIILQEIRSSWIPQLIGQDVSQIEILHEKLLQTISNDHARFYFYFLSAIDIACWDIKLQFENKSLAMHCGIQTKVASVYGSCGWLQYSPEELLADCQHFVDLGVFTYKIQLGCAQDYERLKLLRATFGDTITLLVDANQAYSYEQAVDKITMLEKFNVAWFEEPLQGDEDEELSTLSQHGKVAIATGENRLRINSFKELCRNTKVQFIQPDIVRCGGVTSVMKIGRLCDAYQRCFAMHLNPEFCVSISPAFQQYKIEYAEFFPLNYFTYRFSICEGVIAIPQTPGTNVHFSEQMIREYRCNIKKTY